MIGSSIRKRLGSWLPFRHLSAARVARMISPVCDNIQTPSLQYIRRYDWSFCNCSAPSHSLIAIFLSPEMKIDSMYNSFRGGSNWTPALMMSSPSILMRRLISMPLPCFAVILSQSTFQTCGGITCGLDLRAF